MMSVAVGVKVIPVPEVNDLLDNVEPEPLTISVVPVPALLKVGCTIELVKVIKLDVVLIVKPEPTARLFVVKGLTVLFNKLVPVPVEVNETLVKCVLLSIFPFAFKNPPV